MILRSILLALLWVTGATADQIRITLDSEPPFDTSTMQPAVQVGGQPVEPAAALLYRFSWPENAVFTPVLVAVEGGPEGYADFAMQFEMPFSYANSIELATPLVVKRYARPMLETVTALDSAIFDPTASLSDLVRYHQRALHFLRTARSFMTTSNRAANKDDGDVAFGFARVTRRLMTEHFMSPDAQTRDILDWIADLVAKPSDAHRVWSSDEIAALQTIFTEIDAAPGAALTTLMLEIEQVASAAEPGVSAIGCGRASALQAHYQSLYDAGAGLDALAGELRNMETVTICSARSLGWLLGNQPDEAGRWLAEARASLDTLRRRVTTYDTEALPASQSAATRRRLGNRMTELEELILALGRK